MKGRGRGGGGKSPNWKFCHYSPHCSKQYNTLLFLVEHKEQIQSSINHPLVSIDVWMFETMIHLVNEDSVYSFEYSISMLSNFIFIVMFYRMSWMILHRFGMHTPLGHQRTSVTPVVGPV